MSARDLIPTNRGLKSDAEIVSVLMLSSYMAQRDDGMSAANAQRLLGVPAVYEAQYLKHCRLDRLRGLRSHFLAQAGWCESALGHARTKADGDALREARWNCLRAANAARRKAARVVRGAA